MATKVAIGVHTSKMGGPQILKKTLILSDLLQYILP